MPLPRLPDLSLDTWIRDQQQQFERTISSLAESLEFKDAVSDIESTVPADFPYPGGEDQWGQAAEQEREAELRRQQEEDERRKAQIKAEEDARQYEAYLNEKMRLDQEEQRAQQDVLMQSQQAGIASPDQALAEFQSIQPGSQPVQDFQNFASQIEQGQVPDGLGQQPAPLEPTPPMGVPSAVAPARRGVPSPYSLAPPTQEEPTPPPPERRGVPSPYSLSPDPTAEPSSPPSRPYWQPTETEQAGMAAPAGADWLPAPIRQAIGTTHEAVRRGAAAEPIEAESIPTPLGSVPLSPTVRQALGSLEAANEPLSAAGDYLYSRGAHPLAVMTPDFARQGILKEHLSPEEWERYSALSNAIDTGVSLKGGVRLIQPTPEGREEYRRYQEYAEREYQKIKDDPDELMRYYHAAPGSEIIPGAASMLLGAGLGSAAKTATTGAARALGAGSRVTRAAGYLGDIAGQTVVDPTTPAFQPAADLALKGIGAGVRGARSLAGRAGQALIESAEEAPAGTQRLGSGVIPRRTEGIDSFFREDSDYGPVFSFTDQENPVPRGANLLPMHWASVGQENVDKINRVLGRNVIYEGKGDRVYEQLTDYFREGGLEDPQWEANRVLHQAGFDGLEDLTVQGYVGGVGAGQGESAMQVFLFPEAIGREIGPRANVRPPKSLEESVRAATQDTDFADFDLDLGSGVVQGLRRPAYNFAQGGVLGAASEDAEAAAEGRDPDMTERLRRVVGMGALAAVGGSRTARRTLGRGLMAVGSGVVPEGAGQVGRNVPIEFQTAKGSTYELLPDGTTIRNKAPRSDPGHEGDFGPKPQSDATYFLTEDNAKRLGLPEGPSRIVDHGDGTLSVATQNANGRWGIAPSQRNVPYESEPTVGLLPLEVWQPRKVNGLPAYSDVHFGNAITRVGADDIVVNYWEPTAAERAQMAREDAEIAKRPAHGGYLSEDEIEAADDAEDVVAAAAGGTPPPPPRRPTAPGPGEMPPDEDFSQDFLPGMTPPKPRPPSEAQQAQTAYREAREGVREEYQAGREPVPIAEIETRAARLRKVDPGELDQIIQRGLAARPGQRAVDSRALAQEAAGIKEAHLRSVEDLMLAERRQEAWLADQGVDLSDDAARKAKLREAPDDIVDELEAALHAEAAMEADFKAMQRGEFVETTAAGQVLRAARTDVNARRAWRQIGKNKAYFEKIQRDAAELLAKGQENLTPADWRKLEQLGKWLDKAGDPDVLDEITGKGVQDIEREGIARVREARGKAGEKATTAKAVPEETLAERYGRLARRFDEFNAAGDQEAAQVIRRQMDETYDEIRVHADERAVQILDQELKDPLSPEEGMKAIQKAIGDKVVRRENFQALLNEEMREGPGGKVLSRQQWKDLLALDKVFNRRLDAALKSESNQAAQLELRTMMSDARHLMTRAVDDPDFAPLQQEFRDRLEELRKHPGSGQNTGEKMAKILEDRYADLQLDRAGKQAYRSRVELLQSYIRGVRSQLDEVVKLRDAPGAGARVQDLLDDMREMGGIGKRAADEQEQRLLRQNLRQMGEMSGVEKDRLRDALATVRPDDPASVEGLLAALRDPTWWGKLREGQYISLLSNYWTLGRNVTSNLMNLVGLVPQGLLEDVYSGRAARGEWSTGAAIREGWKARGEAGRRAWDVQTTGRSRADIERLTAGDVANVRREYMSERPGIQGKIGVLLHQVSTRPLEATDQMLGHLAYQSEVGRLAQRKADDLLKADSSIVRGMNRNEARDWILADIWEHPEIIRQAGEIKDYTLLRSRGKSGLENAARRIAAFRDPGLRPGAMRLTGAIASDFILPFFNVVLNYTKQGFERTIGAPIDIGRGIALMQRGKTDEAAAKLAKGTIGMSAMMAASPLVDFDLVTGPGPQDKTDRDMWLEDHEPFSVSIGGRWWSYANTPLAIPFAMVAGMKEGAKEAQRRGAVAGTDETTVALKSLWGGARGAGGAFASQTFLQGMTQQLEIVTSDTLSLGTVAQLGANIALRYGSAAGIATGVAPVPIGLMNFFAVLGDHVERDAGRPTLGGEILENVGARIAQRVPGLRQQLSPRIGAYGEEVINQRSFQESGIIPILPMIGGYYEGRSPRPNDPVTKSLQELSVGRPPAPEKITLKGGIEIPLTLSEQRAFDRTYGQTYRELLDSIEEMRQDVEKSGGERPVFDAAFYERVREASRKAAVGDLVATMDQDELIRRVDRSVDRQLAAPRA